MSGSVIVRLFLWGVFRLESANRDVIAVPSRKARALIALLALSRDGERSRVWLQDMLWGRCERPEAQGSLRRELSSLRAALDQAAPQLLDIGRETVRLRLELCEIDAVTPHACFRNGDTLLEGMDLPGEESFEDWLRTERQSRAIQSPESFAEAIKIQPLPSWHEDRLSAEIRLEAWHNGAPSADFLPEVLQQAIAAGLDESGLVRVNLLEHGERRPQGTHQIPDVELSIKTTSAADRLAVVILARRAGDHALLVAHQDVIDLEGGWTFASSRLRTLADRCVDQLLHRAIIQSHTDDDAHRARKAALTAVEQMFSLDPAMVRLSRETLATATSIQRRGVFLAWKAYQAVFLADPGHAYDYRLTVDECREDMRLALSLDPHNGLVLSLCSFVHAFLLRDFFTASELMDRATATGTRHVMHHDALALLRFYTGRYGEARQSAILAREAGRNISFRYCFETTLSMIEALAGNHATAVAYGNRALALEPASRKISYPPTLRYLGATFANLGRIDDARALFSQLSLSGRPADSGSVGSFSDALPNPEAAEFVRAGFVLAGQ